MKVVQKTVYIADDDKVFDTEEGCRKYEAAERLKMPWLIMANRPAPDFVAAKNGFDPELATAIEIFGGQLAKARRDQGTFKRSRKAKPADAAPPAPPAASPPEPPPAPAPVETPASPAVPS